jgi:RsiW-degrading membrane proteinase PrsW (M82 family)
MLFSEGVFCSYDGVMVRTAEEYNWRTLFAPRLKGRPFMEAVAVLATHPAVWVLEIIIASPIVLLSLLAAFGNLGVEAIPVVLIGGLAAIGFPAFYTALYWLLDIYEREPKRIIVSLFLWGAASATFCFVGNTLFGALLSIVVDAGAANLLGAVIGAPIIEEIFKAAGLIVIAWHFELEDTFDGILYGFAVGMGFAAVENFLYFTVNVTPGEDVTPRYWLAFVIYRSVLCALAHGSFTATTGSLIGFLKNRPWGRSWAPFGAVISVIAAMVLHGLFNLSAAFQTILAVELFDEPLVPLFHGPLVFLFAGFWLFIATPLALMETKRRMAALRA